MKVELDGRENLLEKDMESVTAALDSTATAEGELIEFKAELKVVKVKLGPLKDELEQSHQSFKAALALANGLKIEKSDLLLHNTKLDEKLVEAQGNVERWEASFQDSAFLKESFRKHPDFSDAGFKVLMNGIAAMTLEVDLGPFKVCMLRSGLLLPTILLVLKTWWTNTGRSLSPSMRMTVKRMMLRRPPKQGGGCLFSGGNNSTQRVASVDYQEIDLLASQRELGSHLGSN